MSFTSTNGWRLSGWYVPSRNRATIVVTHGTNADRSMMLPEVQLLAEAGFGVLAFDWPGLGLSTGDIRWDVGATNALTAALDWLSTRTEVDATKIGGLGFSMGGFIMVRVAATDRRLCVLVLEGTPTSFEDYTAVHNGRWGLLSRWPARWAVRNSGLLTPGSAPEDLIGAVSPRPVLLIGGTLDTEVPEAMIHRLYAAAREPKFIWIVSGAQHGGYSKTAPLDYPRRLVSYFSTALIPARNPMRPESQ